jgi:putative tryptophan/tyrosine transport system substrate-binding protein
MRARRLGSRWSIIVVLGLAAAVLLTSPSRAAEPAQRLVRVGLVDPYSSSSGLRGVDGFWQRLHELGWAEGQNLVIEARWADGHIERLPALMTEVIERKVDVIVTNTTPGAVAAKNATTTVPIVGVGMGDPIRTGLAASLARPGGNVTGLSAGLAEGMAGKWLELLQDTVPRLSTVAVIANPDNAMAREMAGELQAIAPTRSLKLRLIEVREAGALRGAFEQAGRKAQAVLVLPGQFEYRRQITTLAAKHRLPAIYTVREYVEAGGLMAYTPDFAVMWRRAADYVDKILKGAQPGELPIEQPTQFELVINLKTAKALGITIPESVLVRADEVIR